jgi:hypothetical protein
LPYGQTVIDDMDIDATAVADIATVQLILTKWTFSYIHNITFPFCISPSSNGEDLDFTAMLSF